MSYFLDLFIAHPSTPARHLADEQTDVQAHRAPDDVTRIEQDALYLAGKSWEPDPTDWSSERPTNFARY